MRSIRRKRFRALLIVTLVLIALMGPQPVPLVSAGTAWAMQQPPPPTPGPEQPKATDTDPLGKILEFVYTASHWLGQLIMSAVKAIFPNAEIPATLVDAIGFLSLLTAALVVAEVAKKLVWIVVGIGWLLIAVRVALIILEGLPS